MSLIFLDIDGVLNSHDATPEHICGIHAEKIARLNRLVKATDADLVISSAWRYMISSGAMTIAGFRYMLMTHGLATCVRITGHTKPDELIAERGDQIRDYLNDCGWPDYVVLDDGSEEPQSHTTTMSESLTRRHAERWVKVDGAVGLTDRNVDAAITLLHGRTA